MGANVSTNAFHQKNVSHTKKSRVIAFRSLSRWKDYSQASKHISKLFVVKFTASWCGPCHNIKPAFDHFAEIYSANVEFVKIDVDDMEDVAKEFGVQAMPTFILMKSGKEVDRLVGAKTDELQMKIEKQRKFLRL